VIALLIGVCGALGTFYLYTAIIGWRGVGLAPINDNKVKVVANPLAKWMTQAGLEDVTPKEFVVATIAAAIVVALLSFVIFGAPLPAIVVGLLGATGPAAIYRNRRAKLRSQAREAWPRLIEELRVQTSSIGRSVPVALLDVGSRSTIQPMRKAFEAANREWLLTTDFTRTIFRQVPAFRTLSHAQQIVGAAQSLQIFAMCCSV
jgi:tight adherence protein B